MVNDTINDMLTRVRNANLAKYEKVFIFNTKINRQISELLKKEGYIKSFKITKDSKNYLELTLKYFGQSKKPCIKNLKRLSSSGLRFYSGYKDIPRIFNGMGIIILSTSKGIITDRDARFYKIGGELLCSIW